MKIKLTRYLPLAALPLLTATLSAQTQLSNDVARTHFPDLHDPELDGGVSQGFSRGEVTPDGRLIVAYRKMEDDFDAGDGLPAYTGVTPKRIALTVASIDPDAFTVNPSGHLVGFTNNGEHVFGDEAGATEDWKFVHWVFAVKPWDQVDSDEKIDMTGSPFWNAPEPDLMYDHDYPIPFNDTGASMITVAMRSTFGDYRLDPVPSGQTPGTALPGNPYPSDENGEFLANGEYRTYHLWVVRLHGKGFYDPTTGDVDLVPGTNTNGPIVVPPDPLPQGHPGDQKSLVCQDLRVVVATENTTEGYSKGEIVSADVGAYDFVRSQQLQAQNPESPEGTIRALEPTITADGKLIIYNGSGAEGDEGDNGRVTYVYNTVGCSTDGWTAPDTITRAPALADTGYSTMAEFEERYKIFATEIRMPPSVSDPDGYVFASGDSVHGPYPWISRDGSFYIAGGTHSNEAQPNTPDYTGRRAGTYACGEITGGYMKLLDGNGLNPTRHGAQWSWPLSKAQNDKTKPSERSVLISPGLSPGMWEFLPDDDVPIPNEVATRGIPLMPVIFTNSEAYGEIRFEEGDGQYLLYLPCNESLTGAQTGLGPGEDPGKPVFDFDTSSTPDTSGRSLRGYGELNAGAAFPRETFENDGQTAEDLREAIGAAYTADPNFYPGTTFETLHSNLGFRGQGIVMNDTGQVELGAQDWNLTGRFEVTAQLFVKLLSAPSDDLALLEHQVIHVATGTEYPLLTIGVDSDGVPYGSVMIRRTGSTQGPAAEVVTADYILSQQSSLTDNKEGWHHLAFVYQGVESPPGESTLTIWVDGVATTRTLSIATEIPPLPAHGFTTRTVVGPGEGSETTVTPSNATLVIDEVAFSDVARTEWEIRRDACVELPDDGFEAAPTALAAQLPTPFTADDVKWPSGEVYDQAIVDLGEDLFSDTILGDPAAPAQRSCASCHLPTESFVDEGQTLAQGLSGSPLPFNTPTLLNAGLGGHKTFSGQAASIEEQVVIPLTSAEEMGDQELSDIVARLNATSYAADFDSAFGTTGGATEENLERSLAMYVRTLYEGNAAFDQETLTANEAEGMALFFGKARCFSCHSGPNFTDEDFHNVNTVLVGAAVPDHGSFTSHLIDIGALKTPTLRGLTGTGPYFHDGSATSLDDVVSHYNEPSATGTAKGTPDRHLRPLDLTQTELDRLVDFLEALSD